MTEKRMARRIFVRSIRGNLPHEGYIEIVERKGLGHPDTICDNVAEQVSIELSKYYLDEFGSIMHHNVDKVLLVGGVAAPSYNGGKIVEPIEIFIAGRAIGEKNGKQLPIEDIALFAVNNWIKGSLRHVDIESQIRVHVNVRPGSRDLIDLFERFGRGEVPLSNDTSIGTGFYPYDDLERIVKETEMLLNGKGTKEFYPFIGEDVKVMGVRTKGKIKLTVAMATVDRYISSLNDYVEKVALVRDLLLKQINANSKLDVKVNTADNYKTESIYLTVSGTSAEQGDDGEVGRGNRVNGLITPYRPMTLEAAAGKNPVSHVGKIYNIFACELSREIVERGYANQASVYVVSQIGKPINEPEILDIRIKGKAANKRAIMGLADEMLDELPSFWKKSISGRYTIS